MKTDWRQRRIQLLDTIWNIEGTSKGWPFKVLLKSLRLLVITGRELSQGQLTLRAMSLVYTTLLSLVPLLAVSFSVLKAFGVHNKIQPLLISFLAPLGQKGYEITEKIVSFVENVKVGVLGSIGLALLIYTVISLVQKIESAFNYVWRIRKSRSFVQKFSNYLSVILVGPVLVFSAMGITASIMNANIVQTLILMEPLGTIILLMGKLVPFFLICVAFIFIYIFIPNTKVRFSSALVGGLFAGILWQTTGWIFASFIVNSTKYTAIYSGFAILIMFMIWLYLSWLILLIGAVMSFHFQYPQYSDTRTGTLTLSNRLKERTALMIMYLIGDSYFYKKRLWTLDSIVQRLRMPFEPIQTLLDMLEQKGYVLTTGHIPPRYIPARDLEGIILGDLYTAIRSAEEKTYASDEHTFSSPQVDEVIQKVDESISNGLNQDTLKTLILSRKP